MSNALALCCAAYITELCAHYYSVIPVSSLLIAFHDQWLSYHPIACFIRQLSTASAHYTGNQLEINVESVNYW